MKRRTFLISGAAALVLPAAGALATPPLPDDSRQHLAMAESPGQVLALVQALDGSDRSRASVALAALSVSCPFTRAALATPMVLQVVAAGLDPGRFEAGARSQWQQVRAGLDGHVAILDALDVRLPTPGPGDVLGGARPELMRDREALVDAPDPIAGVHALALATPELAANIGASERTRIEALSDEVEAATGIVRFCPRGAWSVMPGHPWRLGALLKGHLAGLELAAARARDPEAREVVTQMAGLVALVDATNLET